MMTTRGTTANPIPSQFNPLIERLARLWLKQQDYEFSGGYEKLLRSQNIRAKRAIAFAIAYIQELEEWMLDASGNGLEEFGEFITGENKE
jgi:hypothetical protein